MMESMVVGLLRKNALTIATAESCTGGLISKRITDIPGSSSVFDMGVVTYSNSQKTALLGVPKELIDRFGAVSPQVAAVMAIGARRRAKSSIAVSATGIAGPGGGSPDKPVGLVYIALADKYRVWVRKAQIHKPGRGRKYIRQTASSIALNMVRKYLMALPGVMPGLDK